MKLLQAFYSDEQVRANSSSGLFSPFNISAGDDLKLEVDNKTFTVIFEQNDFAIPNSATALEVSNVLNRNFTKNNLDAFAKPVKDHVTGLEIVRIFSGALGLKGSVRVIGGKAQNVLLFPTKLNTTQVTSTQWTITTIAPETVRFSFTGGTNPSLYLLNIGDYVNVFGTLFNPFNRGSFEVTNVGLDFFEIKNAQGLNEVVVQSSSNDILFFSSTYSKLTDSKNIAFAAQGGDVLDIFLPVTTEIIKRDKESGTYFYEENPSDKRRTVEQAEFEITFLEFQTPNKVIIDLAGNSDFVAGESILFYPSFIGADPTYQIPEGTYEIAGVNSPTQIVIEIPYVLVNYTEAVSNYFLNGNFKDSDGKIFLKLNSVSRLTNNLVINEKLTVSNPTIPNYSLRDDLVFSTVGYSSITSEMPNGIKIDESNYFFFGGDGITDTYIYNLTDKALLNRATCPISIANAALVKVDNSIFVIGGNDNGNTLDTIYKYDIELDTWILIKLMNVKRDGAKAALLPNNTIFIIGGNSSARLAEVFDLSTGNIETVFAHDFYADVPVLQQDNDGHVFVYANGGKDVLIYDCWQNVIYWNDSAPLGLIDSGVTFWNNKIFTAGGIESGTIVTNFYTYDIQSRVWKQLANVPIGIYNCKLYPISDYELMLFDGLMDPLDVDSVNTDVYIYNVIHDTWRLERTFAPAKVTSRMVLSEAFPNEIVYVSNGAELYHYFPIFTKYSGQLNNFTKINAVNGRQVILESNHKDGADNFTPISASVLSNEGVAETGLMTLMTNLAHESIGYYWVDKIYEISGHFSSTNQEIAANSTITTLNVNTLSNDFPEQGFILIGLGMEYQTGPVPYLFKIGNSILNIDPDYLFKNNIPSGASIIYVKDRNISAFEDYPSVILTDSVTPRLYAESLIEKIKAVGAKVSKTILYPGTIGLGNSQIPTTVSGKPKLNDAIYIWGTQDYLNKKRQS